MTINIVSTPLRVSFLGGGSDYEAYFSLGSPGFTFGTTINLSVFLSGIYHSRLSDFPFKLTYRITDSVTDYRDFKHPVAKHAFEISQWPSRGLHVSTMADVPAGTGLGSSSSFTVGLLHLLETMQEREPNADWLAKKAVEIERIRLCEMGGLQDQYFAAYGGTRLIEFGIDGVKVSPTLPSETLKILSNSLVLVPIGVSRDSSSYAGVTAESSKSHQEVINEMATLARVTYNEFLELKGNDIGVQKLGNAIRHSWELKKIISKQSENDSVNSLIAQGISMGAYGGKLCGAGGSGFILFIVDPTDKTRFISRFQSEGAQEITINERGSQSFKLEQN